MSPWNLFSFIMSITYTKVATLANGQDSWVVL